MNDKTADINEEIINLIRVQYDITKNEISDYSAFAEQLIDENDRNILNDVLIIKNKHCKMLGELYYRFKGERLRNSKREGEEAEETDKYISTELEKAVLAELENAETYRSLTGDFLNLSVRDVFSEIMTDCQNNALRFSILFAKYSK